MIKTAITIALWELARRYGRRALVRIAHARPGPFHYRQWEEKC